jgi:hypothetical protein
MTKTLNQIIYFFPPPEYFFQQHWESEYFFRKKPNCEIVQAFIDEIDSWLLSNGVSIPFTMLFLISNKYIS